MNLDKHVAQLKKVLESNSTDAEKVNLIRNLKEKLDSMIALEGKVNILAKKYFGPREFITKTIDDSCYIRIMGYGDDEGTDACFEFQLGKWLDILEKENLFDFITSRSEAALRQVGLELDVSDIHKS
jgi:hypothetical protein